MKYNLTTIELEGGNVQPKDNIDSIASKLESAVVASGLIVQSSSHEPEIKASEGHRSIVTLADKNSQTNILSSLNAEDYPNLKFLCEEDADDPRVLPKQDPVGIMEGVAAIVDPLDGSALYASFYPEWTVGGGLLQNGHVVSSAITAPQANGGMILASRKSNGVFFHEGCGPSREIHPLGPCREKESVVLRGVDTELYLNITNLMPRIASRVRAVYIAGSGLFGLMQVALGRAAAIIQTPQKAWDWIPAYNAVLNTGRVFFFFRLVDGKLIHVNHYDFEAFKLEKECRLGFVAGEEYVAEELIGALPEIGWERFNPDTIKA